MSWHFYITDSCSCCFTCQKRLSLSSREESAAENIYLKYLTIRHTSWVSSWLYLPGTCQSSAWLWFRLAASLSVSLSLAYFHTSPSPFASQYALVYKGFSLQQDDDVLFWQLPGQFTGDKVILTMLWLQDDLIQVTKMNHCTVSIHPSVLSFICPLVLFT